MIVQLDEQAQIQQVRLQIGQIGLAFQQRSGQVGPIPAAKRPGRGDRALGRLLPLGSLHAQASASQHNLSDYSGAGEG